MSDTLRITQSDQVATVEIHNLDRRNALTKPMWLELAEVMTRLGQDMSLRAIILRGAAPGGFGAGADIHEFVRERDGFDKAKSYGLVHAQAVDAIQQAAHPVIAAVDGPCMGASLVLCAACDLRIASVTAQFALPPIKLGVTLGYPELTLLRDLVGVSALQEMLYEGQVFSAERAQQMGLITRTVSEHEFEDEIQATAARVAKGAPLTQRFHKAFLLRLRDGAPLSDAEFDEGYKAFDSADFKEGYASFLEKRRAVFQGK